MATITIQDENRTITDANEVNEFLQPFGICFEKWDVEGRIGPEATNEEILGAYTEEIDRLKESGGFVTADVINVTADTPVDSPFFKTDSKRFACRRLPA